MTFTAMETDKNDICRTMETGNNDIYNYGNLTTK